jgi:signal transduction histidine kinase
MQPLITEAWGLVAIDEKASQVRFTNIVETADVVTGNPDRLMQVFVNLLRNALYAVHTNGAIVVRSRRFSRNGQAWIAVSVDDDGPGIPPDVLPNIFEAFVSSRLDARGTGLGLTVAEGIVDQHGGTIAASNRLGGGACLEVTLPAVASGAKEKVQ